MAAAARSGSGPSDASGSSGASGPSDARDARVPCPLCGGLVHPIAGRCKHCKADLTGHQVARPASAIPLPAVTAVEPARSAAPPAVAIEPRASGWRSWPGVVIGLAMVAIVVAVVLMVWPAAARGGDGKHTLGPPPAPEHMQTAPD